MSFGGVLGGIFSALVAPQLFNSIWEFPLLLVLGIAMRPGLADAAGQAGSARACCSWAAPSALVLVLLKAALSARPADGGTGRVGPHGHHRNCGRACSRKLDQHAANRPCSSPSVRLAVALLPSAMNCGDAERSFFGVHRVTTTADGQMRMLLHGTTMHGAQRIKDESGTPIDHPVPMAYYYPEAPMTRGVELARRATGKSGADFRAGVVGLGAGVMACNSRAGRALAVLRDRSGRCSRSPAIRKQFTFLSTLPAERRRGARRRAADGGQGGRSAASTSC